MILSNLDRLYLGGFYYRVATAAPAADALPNHYWLQKPIDHDQLLMHIDDAVGTKENNEIA